MIIAPILFLIALNVINTVRAVQSVTQDISFIKKLRATYSHANIAETPQIPSKTVMNVQAQLPALSAQLDTN